MRVCAGCKLEKGENLMARNKHAEDGSGLSSYCKVCSLEEYRADAERERKRDFMRSQRHPEGTRTRLRVVYTSEMSHKDAEKARLAGTFKACATCGAQKPLADYPKSMRNPDETRTARVCWACINKDPEGRAKLARERATDTLAWTRTYRKKAYLAAQSRYNAKRGDR